MSPWFRQHRFALGGRLEVRLTDDYVPVAGDAFDILAAQMGLSGAFAVLVARMEQEDGKFSSLLMGVIESAPFQRRRARSPA